MGNHLSTIRHTDAHTETLLPRQEAFARQYAEHGNAGRAYREVFDVTTASPATVRQRGYELVHQPAVAARIRELHDKAAEGTLVSARSRMVRLQEIVEADPSELVQVVVEPCGECWPDDMSIALAMDAALADGRTLDLDAPQPTCKSCRGHGAPRVVVTPTDQLSPSARRLLKSIRQKASGEIEVRLHDQLQAADILNRMQSVYVERSMSVTAHVNVPALKNMSQAEALDFLESIRPTRPAPPVAIDAEVVDCANDVQTLCITPENTTP